MKTEEQLEKTIGIKFKNKDLLRHFLVHRSYLNEHSELKLDSNERLEFLGDSILEFISSLYLFKKFPDYSEGDLTNIRSCLVRTSTLAEIAQKLNLGKHLLLSRGEEDLGGRNNPTLLANCFEALIGAIFLDQDIQITQKIMIKLLAPKLKQIIKEQKFKDSKSL